MLEEGAVYNLPVLPLDGGCGRAGGAALSVLSWPAALLGQVQLLLGCSGDC